MVKTTGDGVPCRVRRPPPTRSMPRSPRSSASPRERWAATGPLRVRMGVHTGEAELRDGDYFGTAVNRAARLMAVGARRPDRAVARDRGARARRATTASSWSTWVSTGCATWPARARVPGRARRRCRASSRRCDRSTRSRATCRCSSRRSSVASASSRRSATALDESRLGDADRGGRRGQDPAGVPGGGGGAAARSATAHGCASSPPRATTTRWSQVVATALGVQPRPGVDRWTRLVEFLRAKRLLLVLDNCEHLLDAARRARRGDRCGLPGGARPGDEPGGPRGRGRAGRGRARRCRCPDADADLDAILGTATRCGCSSSGRASGDAELRARRATARGGRGDLPAARRDPARDRAGRGPGRRDEPGEIAGRSTSGSGCSPAAAAARSSATRPCGRRSTGRTRCSTRPSGGVRPPGRLRGRFDATGAVAVVAGDGIEAWDVLDALASLVAKSMVVARRRRRRRRPVTSMLETLRAVRA